MPDPQRIKDFTVTATTPAVDDYLALDGAAEGTRKILASDFLSALAQNDAFIVVLSTADPAANGIALLAAYAAASALTPNGGALSATNRACVIVPPGKYTLVSPLNLVAYVDLISASDNWEETLITSAITTASGGTVVQGATAGDVLLRGLWIRNTASTQNANDSTDAAAFHFFASLSATKCVNCKFDGSGTSWGMTQGANCDGNYTRCIGTTNCFGSHAGQFLGFAADCTAGDDSFGTDLGGNAVVTRCVGGARCFGTSQFFGTAYNCVAGQQSFGTNAFSGYAEGCIGTIICFGGNAGTHSGVTVNCRGTGACFGANFQGLAINCFAGNFSFGSGGTFSGVARRCYAGENSFGDGGNFSGILDNCVCGIYSGNLYSSTFSPWSVPWAPTAFTGAVNDTIFSPSGSNLNAVTLANGATGSFLRCTFRKTGSGTPLALASGSATINFSYCQFNTAGGVGAGITNGLGGSLAAAFNIGSTAL